VICAYLSVAPAASLKESGAPELPRFVRSGHANYLALTVLDAMGVVAARKNLDDFKLALLHGEDKKGTRFGLGDVQEHPQLLRVH